MITTIKDLRQAFFAYRNGILADALKATGNPHSTIFGLNIPQISAIAREAQFPRKAIDEMWKSSASREERLMSLYLLKPYAASMSIDELMELAKSVKGPEEADMIAFKVLKHSPYAPLLVELIEALDTQVAAYTAKSLTIHLD